MGVSKETKEIVKGLLIAGVQALADAIDEKRGRNAKNGNGQMMRQVCETNTHKEEQDLSKYSVVVNAKGIVFPHVIYGEDNKVFMAKWPNVIRLEVADLEDGKGCFIQLRGGIVVGVPLGLCYPIHTLETYQNGRRGSAMSDEAFFAKMDEWTPQACGLEIYTNWMQEFFNSVRAFRVLKNHEDSLWVTIGSTIHRMHAAASLIGREFKRPNVALAIDQTDPAAYERSLEETIVRYGIPFMMLVDKLLGDLLNDSDIDCSQEEFVEIKSGFKERAALVSRIRSLDSSLISNAQIVRKHFFKLDWAI